MSDVASEELMAWLQEAFRAAGNVRAEEAEVGRDWGPDARRGGPNFKYGISTSSNTIDMDFSADDYNVSLVRIVAIAELGKVRYEMKRFAGPRDEAYDEANEWRQSLRGSNG